MQASVSVGYIPPVWGRGGGRAERGPPSPQQAQPAGESGMRASASRPTSDGDADDVTGSLQEPEVTRSRFQETWLWEKRIAGLGTLIAEAGIVLACISYSVYIKPHHHLILGIILANFMSP